MRIHNYSKEKPEVNHGELYLKVGLLGAFLAFFFIGGFKLIIYLIKLAVEYWIWVIGIMALAFIVRHLLKRKRFGRIQDVRLVG